MKEIAVLCTEIAVDSKCGYTETLKLYYALAEKYKISLIVPRFLDIYIDEVKTSHPNVTIKSIICKQQDKFKKESFFSPYIVMSEDTDLQNEFRKAAYNADLIVCESIYYVLLAKYTFPERKIIYRSVDIEYDKFKWFSEYTVVGTDYSEEAFDFEKKSCEAADLIFTLSEHDASRLCELYDLPENKILGRIPICFSNAEISENYVPKRKTKNSITKGLFISAAQISEPEKFVDSMRKLPQVEFHIIGNGGYFLRNCSDNVIIHGKVSEQEKKKLILECDFAINITKMTFGMNAKNIEYFSLGIPVIANELGVRGYNVIPGRDYVLAEEDNLEEGIDLFCKLSEDERYLLAQNAFYHLCDEYNYQKYLHYFDELIGNDSDKNEESYYIFGAGLIGKSALKHFNTHGIKCHAFVDNSSEKQRKGYCGIEVVAPDEAFRNINSSETIKLLIAANAKNSFEIIRQSVHKIDAEKIVIYNDYALSIDDMKAYISTEKIRNLGGRANG